MGPSPNLRESNVVPVSEGTARGEGVSMKSRAAASPTFSGMRVWPGPGEADYRQAGQQRGCSQPKLAIMHVRVHVPAHSHFRRAVRSLRDSVWPRCTSWRGRQGGARQGAWHERPAFCTYVSLATI